MPHQCTTCGRSFEDGSKEMLSGCPDCGGNKFQFQPAGAVDESAGRKTNSGAASAATARKKTPESVRSDATDTPETGTTDALETEGDGRASAVNRAASTVRDWVGKRNDDSPENGATGSTRNDAPSETRDTVRTTETAGTAGSPKTSENAVPKSEDSAQASARSDVVSKSELPDEPSQSTATAGPATGSNSTAHPDPTDGSDPDANVVDAPDEKSPDLKELREELNSQFESIRIEEPGQYELNLMELYEREEYIISLQEDGKYIIEVPDAWDATDR
jgi:predicted  nucleic acid-binding Zn-ribbon protein